MALKGDNNKTEFFPVSPLMLFPEAMGSFSVYLRQPEGHVLYTCAGETFTEEHRRRLHEMGVAKVFVESTDKRGFDEYVAVNLGRILQDETIQLKERASIFIEATGASIKEALAEKLPGSLPPRIFRRMASVVRSSLDFLSDARALKAMGPFISNDYKTYTHSLQVFLFSISTMVSFGFKSEELFEYGLGALLHDIGKSRIARRVLNKRGALDPAERELIETHPVQGVAMCANLGISQNTFNCILFHHERMDGSGYPSGIASSEIPLAVRIIGMADVYDAMTTKRPYASAMKPFEALNIIRYDQGAKFDMEVYKRFVEVLSGADLV